MKNILCCAFFLFSLFVNSQDLESGLIGHWPLDGNAVDHSSNGNNGEIYGALPVANRFEVVGKAMFFEDSYIDFGNVLNLGFSDLSIAGWFKIDPDAFAFEMVLVSKAEVNSENKYAVGVVGNQFSAVLGNRIFSSEVNLNKEQWYYFSATFDRDGYLKFYLNGNFINQFSISDRENIDLTEIWPLRIGEYSGQGRYFYGAIDDIRIYNRVLTSNEVEALYNLPPDESSLCSDLITNNQVNVGIGTTPQTDYRLSVGGGIFTDKVKVMGVVDWPDYVFSSGYELMGLGEVSSYIEEHGYLPGMPSAAEVLFNGLSLTGIDKANLRKVEELSLHVLELDRRINKLREKGEVTPGSFPHFRGREGTAPVGLGTNIAPVQFAAIAENLFTGGINCDGDNVGIGVSQTSGSRLAVSGGILSEGVKVSSVSNWPDYVFSEDYTLLSLEELRKYLLENGHLPGIPSASAISRDGYSLSEMDKGLMEKIEELTLYIIAMEGELQELSAALQVALPVSSKKFIAGKKVVSTSSGTKEEYLKANGREKLVGMPGGGLSPLQEPLCEVIECDGQDVGIGTEPVSGYRLAVLGGILTDDVQVTSVENWPDYVFEDYYELLDLSSLSGYIDREGHLPGVPKAETLEKEGYHLETMDALFLEKIEELTLYLIQQERQLSFLESSGHRP